MARVTFTPDEVLLYSEGLEGYEPDEFAVGAVARAGMRGFRRGRRQNMNLRQSVSRGARGAYGTAKGAALRGYGAVRGRVGRVAGRIGAAASSAMERARNWIDRRRGIEGRQLRLFGEADIEMPPNEFIQAVRELTSGNADLAQVFTEDDADTMAIVSWNTNEPFPAESLELKEGEDSPALYSEDADTVVNACIGWLQDIVEFEEEGDEVIQYGEAPTGEVSYDVPPMVAQHIQHLESNQFTPQYKEALDSLILQQNALQFSEDVQGLDFVPGTVAEKAGKLQSLYDTQGAEAVEAQKQEWAIMQNVMESTGAGQTLLASHYEEPMPGSPMAAVTEAADKTDMTAEELLAYIANNNPQMFEELHQQSQVYGV